MTTMTTTTYYYIRPAAHPGFNPDEYPEEGSTTDGTCVECGSYSIEECEHGGGDHHECRACNAEYVTDIDLI